MIALDPLPSRHRAAASTGSEACGAGKEDAAAAHGLELAAEVCRKQDPRPVQLGQAQHQVGAATWGSPLVQPVAVTAPPPVSPTLLDCPAMAPFGPWG